MNLHSRSSLDPRWTTHHTKVAVGFMLATVRVIRKDPDSTPVYDQATGIWLGVFTTIFEGNARIAPYGIVGDMVVGQDTTGRRLLRVQVESRETGINVDDMVVVEFCKDFPELVDYTIEVRGSVSSSNAWLTDLVCEADLKMSE